ncbi:MAG: hypothetical protein JWM91_505 [Rhodospirillales bacterium]|nr:hypothetical protein [Rhodospirillales bacterium]
MAAFYTLALALAPKFVQHLVHRNDGPLAQVPSRRMSDTQPEHAPRHRALSCRWERADNGSLVARWVHDEGEPSQGSPEACPSPLLREIPRTLIDDAYHFERHGSVLALIAVSRMARMNHATPFNALTRNLRE